jgi:alpha-1,2-mannosyltransferase
MSHKAAGVIPVAHASGGPLQDIIVPYDGEPTGNNGSCYFMAMLIHNTGFHARDPDSFADALHQALNLPKSEELGMRKRARQWAVQRFSEEEFVKAWDASGWQKHLAVS